MWQPPNSEPPKQPPPPLPPNQYQYPLPQQYYYPPPARKPFPHGWYIILLFGPIGWIVALVMAAWFDWCHPKTAIAARVILVLLILLWIIGAVLYFAGYAPTRR